jgi:hypothetical protein
MKAAIFGGKNHNPHCLLHYETLKKALYCLNETVTNSAEEQEAHGPHRSPE